MTGDPRVLFLDQTGALGGGELALRDIVGPYRRQGRVVLFADGPLRRLLDGDGTTVEVLGGGPAGDLRRVRRESGPLAGLVAAPELLRLARRVRTSAAAHDVLYANSQKALLVGALAAAPRRTPLVWHLHDILAPEHFSLANVRLAVTVANAAGAHVVADSSATARAFVSAGGRADRVRVVHYGFAPPDPVPAHVAAADRAAVRAGLGLDDRAFVAANVGRLSPWKGQDVFVRALARVPGAIGLIVGEALFGEDDVEPSLRALADGLGIGDRVVFAGFRSDPGRVMAASDLVVHSSTAPEPFGRVIVEAMLAGTPVVAAAAGGPCEIVDDGRTGWLVEPGDPVALADRIEHRRRHPDEATGLAAAAAADARSRFTLEAMHEGIRRVVDEALARHRSSAGRRRWATTAPASVADTPETDVDIDRAAESDIDDGDAAAPSPPGRA
ncbi:MAG: glycosyltransferase [Actinomycetota bacterium]